MELRGPVGNIDLGLVRHPYIMASLGNDGYNSHNGHIWCMHDWCTILSLGCPWLVPFYGNLRSRNFFQCVEDVLIHLTLGKY